MRNRGFQAIGKGATLAVVTADNRVESPIYRANPNPPATTQRQKTAFFSSSKNTATLALSTILSLMRKSAIYSSSVERVRKSIEADFYTSISPTHSAI